MHGFVQGYPSSRPVTAGSYQCLLPRHLQLKKAKTSVLSKPRNTTIKEAVVSFDELIHAMPLKLAQTMTPLVRPILEQCRGPDGTVDFKTTRAGMECTSRHMVERENEGEE
ncbi:hypothetical protein H257_11922 [Aphanomyces astaci]|uniref:Uncharacterized protein n=1 Tax=Aphanomyces astaci TaxID=112090 RepID=W4G2F4_APHAT|nr:hypothetical protein H257_11922 [Aphanomyces astaci]ETV73098.1 hypothetical protein H257_11922 [Aphanomyces astaci]|eukprot:XP_009837303.1 hypothetical protein H257_11922 [Aphanomyces astaci]